MTHLGRGVRNLAEGDRVAIPWLGYARGACEYCASGRETLCPNQCDSDYSLDGPTRSMQSPTLPSWARFRPASTHSMQLHSPAPPRYPRDPPARRGQRVL